MGVIAVVAGALVLLGSGDDDKPDGPFATACARVAALDPAAPPEESFPVLKELADLDEAVEAEGLDPTGDLTRVFFAVEAYEAGVSDIETIGSALRTLVDTCESAGFDAEPGSGDFAGAFENDDPDPTTTTTTASRSTNTTSRTGASDPGEPPDDCIGVSGCAYDNGIDFQALREEIADDLNSDGGTVEPDDIDCDGGDTPPNHVRPGDSFSCNHYPTPDNEFLVVSIVTVTSYGNYTREWADV